MERRSINSMKSSTHPFRRTSPPHIVIVIVIVAIIGSFFYFASLGYGLGGYLYEDIALRFEQSAARASAYGERHFNSRYRALYDINRAEVLYKKAFALDPQYPYVNHQLARVAFLRGNFVEALAYINTEIDLHGEEEANTYYIRALIEGYAGDYAASARDYDHYLKREPGNWATMNDYAWVLLKAGRAKEAADVTAKGIALFPDNPWLLNSHATALYEVHSYEDALAFVQKASAAVANLTEKEWLHAYPGNDPRSAAQGMASFRAAVQKNLEIISRDAKGGR